MRTLDERLGYLVVRAGLRVRKRYVAELAGLEMLPHHHAILSRLRQHGPTYQAELAAQAGLAPAEAVGYFDSLRHVGYVVRDRDPVDRRKWIVILTQAGADALAEADQVLDALEAGIFACLTEAEKGVLATLVVRLAQTLPA
ncbi:MarR family winged helix-turn-helix transcriptional regulator [Nocardia pseudobrasiliensis]|uniref:MarR family winged helix-turn-helix transcriptional regulator n=1 Tax=Nocardia pseudobrasiliensis TaxID=45979 RepID=UPI00147136A4|nr:MarR family transcriptional regulator [Nocardia pseudobrasiliensis]